MLPALLKRLFARTPRSKTPRPQPRARLTLEALEDRFVPSGSPLAADAERSLTTPTAAWVYTGVDATFLSQRLTADNARITDLEVDSTAPHKFTATLVQNTGDYAKSWWWFYDLTGAQLAQKVSQLQARILDLETYGAGSAQRFAAVLVANTGAQAKTWWYYTNVSQAFLASKLTQNGARLIDLDGYASGATRVYSAVMVKNTGIDAKSWWYYYNQTPASISSLLNQNQGRLIDIESSSAGRFDVVMVRNIDKSWWYHGTSAAQIVSHAQRNGARVMDIESYDVSGAKQFAALMLNNSNALTTRVGDILRSASNTAQVGLYLKQVGGTTSAALQDTRRFEPASALKALLHLHAMRQVRNGVISLNASVSFYHHPADTPASLAGPDRGNPGVNPDSYPETAANRITETLGKVLERMMERSDNRATRAIDKLFGRSAINATAAAAGMTATAFASTFGSGAVGNFLTLRDTGRLYEGVLNGTLLGTGTFRTEFLRRMTDENNTDKEQVSTMWSEGVFGPFATVVHQEAARKLNKPLTDPAVLSLRNSFINNIKSGWKGGGYDLGLSPTSKRVIRTAGGWIQLPFKVGGTFAPRQFVYGVFIENAIVPVVPSGQPNPALAKVDAAWRDSQAELLRDQIRAALATW